ncbi:MAG: hypothetical protein AB1589_03115 [Cyanobacteriota bacterium]
MMRSHWWSPSVKRSLISPLQAFYLKIEPLDPAVSLYKLLLLLYH